MNSEKMAKNGNLAAGSKVPIPTGRRVYGLKSGNSLLVHISSYKEDSHGKCRGIFCDMNGYVIEMLMDDFWSLNPRQIGVTPKEGEDVPERYIERGYRPMNPKIDSDF